MSTLCKFIETRLADVLRELQNQGVGVGLRLVPGSIYLPWRRTFEVDFELQAVIKREIPLCYEMGSVESEAVI